MSTKKMRKETFAFAAGGLLIGIVFGYLTSAGSQDAQISRLQSQVSDLTNQVNSLQAQLTTAQSQVTTLTSEKQALLQQISQLNARIAQLNATIASLSRGEPSILGVYFSPRGGCASTVIYWLGRANSSIHILIYSFTLDSIGDAVLAAHQRGVEVKIVFEEQQVSRYSEFFRLAAAGVQVRNDTNPGLMHHKVAVIDGHIVLIGSFNWSASGDKENNENLLVIRSTDLAAVLEREFQRIWTTGR